MDKALVEYWVALTLTTIPENSGDQDPISRFVQEGQALVVVGLQVFSVGTIASCSHIIPEIATINKTGDGTN